MPIEHLENSVHSSGSPSAGTAREAFTSTNSSNAAADTTASTASATSNLSKFDPRRYRQAEQVRMDDALAGGRKVQTIIPVRKPSKKAFVRVHPDPDYRVQNLPTLEDESTGEIYLVGPEINLPADLDNKVDHLNLATAITADGSLFLWHYKNSTNSWSESARIAQHRAIQGWVRVISDKSSNGYFLESPFTAPPDPAWPSLTFPDILETAFGARLIESLEHPLVKKLRGDFHAR